MRSEFQVARILGIPIKIHWTLLIFIPILGVLIGAQLGEIATNQLFTWVGDILFPWVDLEADALMSQEARLVAGFVAAIGLFVSVLLHELGHAVVALREDIKVKQITLWLFGGLAMLEGITQEPRSEAKIAVAGPIVSLALGLMPAAFLLITPPAPVTLIVAYLAGLNVLLAVFNMLPAFPLDGGRLLRATLATRMPFGKATNLAADIGKGLAVLMGLGGLFGGGIWLMLIAFFIYMGASQEAQGVELFDALDQIQVREIMQTDVPTVAPEAYVDELVPLMLGTRTSGFPVVDGDHLVGVITLSDIQALGEGQRGLTRVREAMSSQVHTVAPDTQASQAMRLMMNHSVGRLPVVEHDVLVGLVTRQGVMQAFEILKSVPRVEVEVIPPEELEGAGSGDQEQDPFYR